MKRLLLIGPVSCTLIGAASGVCWAMLYRQDEGQRARVHLDDSLPALFLGSLVGVFVGQIVLGACRRRPRVITAATLLITTLLGAAIVAPAGWIAAEGWVERQPRAGMALGASLGAVGGLVLGVAQLVGDQRRRRAERDAIANRTRAGW